MDDIDLEGVEVIGGTCYDYWKPYTYYKMWNPN